jgi:hypothetical protein
MKSSALTPLIAGLLIASCALAVGQEEPYLEGMSYGPYRGRVIDAETKQPLEGAVAVAVWSHEKIYALHSSTVLYAAREAVTDGEGRFVIDAKVVEERAPRRTLHPYFIVFLPGYAGYNLSPFSARAFRQGEFSGEGATIGLSRLKTREERLRQVDAADPYKFSEHPFEDTPLFVQAWNRERVNLALQPYLRGRKRP